MCTPRKQLLLPSGDHLAHCPNGKLFASFKRNIHAEVGVNGNRPLLCCHRTLSSDLSDHLGPYGSRHAWRGVMHMHKKRRSGVCTNPGCLVMLLMPCLSGNHLRPPIATTETDGSRLALHRLKMHPTLQPLSGCAITKTTPQRHLQVWHTSVHLIFSVQRNTPVLLPSQSISPPWLICEK